MKIEDTCKSCTYRNVTALWEECSHDKATYTIPLSTHTGDRSAQHTTSHMRKNECGSSASLYSKVKS